MMECGMVRCKVDRCVYVNADDDKLTIVLIYVDDMAVMSNNLEFKENMIGKLNQRFKIKKLGMLNHFLGMRITKDGNDLVLDQLPMIVKILEMFNMQNCKGISTPSEVGDKGYQNNERLDADVPFRKAVGCLLYLATVSRPDIMFATMKMAKVVENPKEKDWISIKRIMRYLQDTKGLAIRYTHSGGELALQNFSDADFGNSDDRRSISGYIAKFGGGAVSWCSRTQ